MVPQVERETIKTGGIPPDAYNIAAAVAAQDALNAGKSMDEAVAAAQVAKDKDESGLSKETDSSIDERKLRDYMLCICQVLHGKFSHLTTARLIQIARLHLGSGIRSFESWAADDNE